MKIIVHQARALRAAQICREQGITQAEIAAAIGASQSQVSRILQGRGFRNSRLLEEVCLYIERQKGGVTSDTVLENDELIEALAAVWDGSATHAKALSMVIRSLSALGKPKEFRSSNQKE